ncbi:MAG: hypothetical protein WCK21_09820, partial [Actinomycetota bacterium]
GPVVRAVPMASPVGAVWRGASTREASLVATAAPGPSDVTRGRTPASSARNAPIGHPRQGRVARVPVGRAALPPVLMVAGRPVTAPPVVNGRTAARARTLIVRVGHVLMAIVPSGVTARIARRGRRARVPAVRVRRAIGPTVVNGRTGGIGRPADHGRRAPTDPIGPIGLAGLASDPAVVPPVVQVGGPTTGATIAVVA